MGALPNYLADLVPGQRLRANQARGTIYRALFRAARQKQPCPTADMLSEITGLCISSTVYHMQDLERRGMIRVWRYQRSRVVQIVCTGEKTASSNETRPHWRERASIQMQQAAE